MSLRCHKCGTTWVKRGVPSRRDRCQRCGSDLRCCKNCRFFALHAPEHCTERDADPVTEKEKANFCEFFQPMREGGGGGGQGNRGPGPNAPVVSDPAKKLKDILGI